MMIHQDGKMITAYLLQERGRSEYMFHTYQERLPKELALAGISDMEAANSCCDQHRCHYVKAKVIVLHYPDGKLAILHEPRKIANYDETGQEIKQNA